MKASTEEKKKRADELTAALAAGASVSPDTPSDTAESSATMPKRSRKRSNSRVPKKASGIQAVTTVSLSKAATISLYQEDHQIIRELSAFLASQGLEVNKSLVIKAALRAVRPGDELLAAYNEARSLDKRMTAKGA